MARWGLLGALLPRNSRRIQAVVVRGGGNNQSEQRTRILWHHHFRLARHNYHTSFPTTRMAADSPSVLRVTFESADGQERTVCEAREGENLLEIAHRNQVDLEGACEASLACSTCHVVVVDPRVYDRLPEASDEENDMLDLAFGLTETSRLGCQVKMTAELDGLCVRIPSATRNMAVDGYKPKPH